MLAATPKVPSSQELFRLVLTLVSNNGTQDIPDTLREHFSTVLTQAKLLIGNSENITGDILPESIELAYELGEIEGLSASLDRIDDIESVSPALAHQLLASMEQYSVYQD